MKLEENSYYHIYHRGIDKRNIFLNVSNYKRFMDRYVYYLYLVADTYAYCLLKNHIHFLIRLRTAEEQEKLFHKYKAAGLTDSFQGLQYHRFKPYSASSQFGHLFNSYTKFFNVQNERSGVLFDGRFKRIKLAGEDYIVNLICYIHRNPIHHGITDNYSTYQYSSYNELLSAERSFLNRVEVFQLLGDQQNFKEAHEEFKLKLEDVYLLEE